MFNVDIDNYVHYVTGSGLINNHITLKDQIININTFANIYVPYTSDVDIDYNIGSECYIVTINDDTCATYLHKAIYWDSKYDFKFNVDKLEFVHEGRKVYISK